MPIVRITLSAEKRALGEIDARLGPGPPRDRRGVRPPLPTAPPRRLAEAHGWSLREAAVQINAYTGTVGLDPGGISA
jgi:hypothetical protein